MCDMGSYTLYHFQWSLFSLMARYTVALRGNAASPETAMRIEEKLVDLHRGENLSEKYLLEVNPKGQVCITLPYAPIPVFGYFEGE